MNCSASGLTAAMDSVHLRSAGNSVALGSSASWYPQSASPVRCRQVPPLWYGTPQDSGLAQFSQTLGMLFSPCLAAAASCAATSVGLGGYGLGPELKPR